MRVGVRSCVALVLVFFPRGSEAMLPPYDAQLRDATWRRAQQIVADMPAAKYTRNERFACGVRTGGPFGYWGDGPQSDEWDTGFSPCWPSSMTVSSSWDVELMARWSRELAIEFGEGERQGHTQCTPLPHLSHSMHFPPVDC